MCSSPPPHAVVSSKIQHPVRLTTDDSGGDNAEIDNKQLRIINALTEKERGEREREWETERERQSELVLTERGCHLLVVWAGAFAVILWRQVHKKKGWLHQTAWVTLFFLQLVQLSCDELAGYQRTLNEHHPISVFYSPLQSTLFLLHDCSAPLCVSDRLWGRGALSEFHWKFFLVFLEGLSWFRCSSWA